MVVPWARQLVVDPSPRRPGSVQVSQCDLFGGKIGTGTAFSTSNSVLPVCIITQTLHAHLHHHVAFYVIRTNGRSFGTFLMQCFFGNWE
jgi:hypothetical protein